MRERGLRCSFGLLNSPQLLFENPENEGTFKKLISPLCINLSFIDFIRTSYFLYHLDRVKAFC